MIVSVSRALFFYSNVLFSHIFEQRGAFALSVACPIKHAGISFTQRVLLEFTDSSVAPAGGGGEGGVGGLECWMTPVRRCKRV